MIFDDMTKEELIEYINNLNEELNGKYGLVWDKEKEPEKIVVDCDKYIPILNEEKNKSINNSKDYNILIEGDNFHSLSVLNYTHKNNVDVIYIDPPYNTGSDEFIYNDKFVDPEDGYRHSKWLNFMEKRLKIARNLLKECGVIFISIDDNELAQLKLLCDKVFGEKSFVKIINVELSATQGMKVKAAKQGNIVKNGEYILVYSKDGHNNIGVNPLKDPVRYDSHYNKYLKRINDNCYEEVNLIDVIKNNKELKKEIELLNLNNITDIYEKSSLTRKWIEDNSNLICRAHDSVDVPENIKSEYKIGYIYKYQAVDRDYLVSKDTKGSISQRILLSEKISLCDDFYNTYGPSRIRGDWWAGFYLDMGNVSKEGGVPFENGKKPVRLIKQLLKFTTNKNSIILDFFAGSGTTGQAVIELNNEDEGNRKFILCTNNELSKKLQHQFKKENSLTEDEFTIIKNSNNELYADFSEKNGICSSKTYPRLKNVLGGNSLKYYKTDFIDYAGTRDQLYYDLTEKCVPMLCVKSATYELVEKNKEYAIYSNADKTNYTCVYFDIFGKTYDTFLDKVMSIKEHKNLYIFSLSEYVNEENFNGITNYSLEPIPYKILDLYKNVVKMSKEN